jgi:hypothetical protein
MLAFPKKSKPARPAKGDTIREQAIALLQRKEGATLPELMKKFDWLPQHHARIHIDSW